MSPVSNKSKAARSRKRDVPTGRAPMISNVTARGQTTIPAELRKKYDIKPPSRLEWLDDGEMMLVIPVPSDPIQSFRGKSRATLTLNLLADRKVQRSREG
ncbi:MAG: AbrB/MazE/SpoVT family DNA-binding domain-containing protein [Candidatus Wallbacteria bacterium]|nr:AbrB/MazE/SpoVT family DNA-binding domain-containing protein [Candidatus Wallbacteria bacterium]